MSNLVFVLVVVVVGSAEKGGVEGTGDGMAVEEPHGVENLWRRVVAQDSADYFFGNAMVIAVAVAIVITTIVVPVMVMMRDLAESMVGWREEGEIVIGRIEIVHQFAVFVDDFGQDGSVFAFCNELVYCLIGMVRISDGIDADVAVEIDEVRWNICDFADGLAEEVLYPAVDVVGIDGEVLVDVGVRI